jgi:hypothetical protein
MCIRSTGTFAHCRALLALAVWSAASGCGGGGSSGSTSSISSVTTSCNPTTVAPGQASQCAATVTGTGNYSSAVSWSVDTGTISTGGLFTAGTTHPGSVHATVTAISTQDATKSGTASIAIITIAPTSTPVTVGEQLPQKSEPEGKKPRQPQRPGTEGGTPGVNSTNAPKPQN